MAISTIGTNGIEDGAIVAADIASGAVTQSKLATGVAGTGPVFSAYNNNSQTFASNAYAQIQPNVKDFDTAGCFNNTGSTVTLNGLSVPAWSFCPNVAGYYQVINSIAMGAVTGVVFGAIYKNGAVWANNGTLGGNYTGAGPGILGSAIVYLNGTGDYVSFYVYQTNSTATTSQNNSGSKCQAYLIRSA